MKVVVSWFSPVCLVIVLSGASGCSEGPRRGLPGDRIELKIKAVELVAEIACDDLSRRQGLMRRESLPENRGMLFLFPQGRRQGFWMRNTLIPLSIAFIDDDGTILQIEHMKPHDEGSTVSINRVRYALEMNRDWFSRKGIAVGDRIENLNEKLRPFRAS
jgi:uncharacterized membrane protein (UPF0127 family)